MKMACRVLACILVFSTVAVAQTNSGLLLYYAFSTNTGTIVTDKSGNGHHGSVYGAMFTTNGRVGGGFQFDGTNDYILGGNLGNIPQGTISFWMNADAVENWRNPFSSDYASWDDCIRFEEDATKCFVVGLGPILGGAYYASNTMQAHTWYHVAFAWTSGKYWGWLNGQPVFSGTHSSQLFPTFNSVSIGNGYSTSPERYWKGLVDEVRIYNRALSNDDVAALANPDSTPPTNSTAGGVALYYSFDTNENGIVTDLTGNGNNGSVHGAQYITNGASGGAYSFSGTNWIQVDNDAFDLDGAVTQLTVCAWVKAQPATDASRFPAIIAKQQFLQPQPAGSRGWIVALTPTNVGTCQLIASYPELAACDGGRIMADGQWHFVCTTFESNPQFMRCATYADGILQATNTRAGSHGSTKSTTPVMIGMRQIDGHVQCMTGAVDEVRIYTRLLSATEIAALAAAGGSGTPTNSGAGGRALYYSFDTNENGIVTDQSGNGNTGIVCGAVWVPDGVRGGAYSFNMTNYISVGNKFDVGTVNSQLTVCAWVKAPPVYTWIWNTIIGKQQAPAPYRGWRVTADPYSRACPQVIATHPEMAIKESTSMIRGDDRWHFVCAVFESTPTKLGTRIYVDGALEATNTRAGTHGATETTDPLLIGYRMSGNEGIKGLIDEVRVFTRSLSDAEIKALYDQVPQPAPAPQIMTIGFSDTPTGEQDVTVFMNDETLYIRVKDVDIVSSEPFSHMRVILTQVAGKPIRQATLLSRLPDGSFYGAVPLSKFRPGRLNVWLSGRSNLDDCYVHQSAVTILPVVPPTRVAAPPAKAVITQPRMK